MTARPNKPVWAATATEVRRLAIISAQELAITGSLGDPGVDQLLLVKQLVNDFDELEAADSVDWQTRVDAIASAYVRRMFQGSTMDRLRNRYTVYGLTVTTLALVHAELEAAFGP